MNDLLNNKVVSTAEAQRFSDEIGIQLYETSAKENVNVTEVKMLLYYRLVFAFHLENEFALSLFVH